jgi:dolichol-phosphate mannosyltransferase
LIRSALQQVPHEIIVVDDNSSDGTFQTARLLADVAVTKTREGQTKGILHGMQQAKYPVIITIDADLENSPECLPELLSKIDQYSIVVASRKEIPRISEKIASKTSEVNYGAIYKMLRNTEINFARCSSRKIT